MANQYSDEDLAAARRSVEDERITLEIDYRAIGEAVADVLLARLSQAITFPTAEDVERIRDHVSPNGVAYQNGVKAGRERERKDVVAFILEHVGGRPGTLSKAGIISALDAGAHLLGPVDE